MKSVSATLIEKTEESSQQVTPRVKVRFGDNKFLDNYYAVGTSEFYGSLVKRLDPMAYWKLDDGQYESSPSNAQDHTGNGYDLDTVLDWYDVDGPIAHQSDYKVTSDDFTRADSALDPGVNSNNDLFWSSKMGTFGISSNQLSVKKHGLFYLATPASFPQIAVAAVNSGGQWGTFEAEFASASDLDGWAMFPRWVSSSNFIVIYRDQGAGTWYMFKIVDGVRNLVASDVSTVSNGDVFAVEITPDCYYAFKKNGTEIMGGTIPESAFRNQTTVGLGSYGYTVTADTILFDNFDMAMYEKQSRGANLLNLDAATIDGADFIWDGDFCISTWLYVTDLSVFRYIFGNADSTPTSSYYAYIGITGEITVVINGATYSETTSTTTAPISVNTWHNVIIQRSGDELQIWVDGVLEKTHYVYDTSDPMETVSGQLFALGQLGDYDTTTNRFAGYMSEVAVFDRALSDKQIEILYLASTNTSWSDASDEFFNAGQLVNITEEETYAWVICDDKDGYGGTVDASGRFYVLDAEPDFRMEYGWVSSTPTDSNGDVVADEQVAIEFDETYMNKLIVTTGYDSARMKDFEYSYRVNGAWTAWTAASFASTESVLEIEFTDTILVSGVAIKPLSTHNPNALFHIHGIVVVYEVDVSDDVIDIDIREESENYEGTLPIGQNIANSMDFTLSNVELKYNPDGTSTYAKYIVPDTKITVELGWTYPDESSVTGETTEYVPFGEFYVDSWDLSTDNMEITAKTRDWSKFLMDSNIAYGLIYENYEPGTAISDILKDAGFPNRKIVFESRYSSRTTSRAPVAYWKMDDIVEDDAETAPLTGDVVLDSAGEFDGLVVLDDDFYEYGYLNFAGLPLTPQDITTLDMINQADARGLSTDVGGVNSSNNQDEASPGSLAIRSRYAQNYVEVTDTLGGLSFVDEFTICGWFSQSSISDFVILEKADGVSDINYRLRIDNQDFVFEASEGGSVYSWTVTPPAATITALLNPTYSAENDVYFVAVSFDGTTASMMINGVYHTDTNPSPFTAIDTVSESLYIGGSRFAPYNTLLGNCWIDHLAIFDRVLLEEEMLDLWNGGNYENLNYLPYLYVNDSTYWDGILEIATADIGHFYFDDNGYFIYEYGDLMNQSNVEKYTTSIANLDEDTNIIAADHVCDIQANKVIVKVNPLTQLNDTFSTIWSAPENESLAIMTTTAACTKSDTVIHVSNTEKYRWYDTGYVKLDDEIIKYTRRTQYTLSGLTRGMFGTKVAYHANGIKAREARHYEIEYTATPVIKIKYPFITKQIWENEVDVDLWRPTAFGAELVISATDVGTGLIVLQGQDAVTGEDNLFAISGIPLLDGGSGSKEKIEETAIASNEAAIRKFRIKDLTIDNKFIQNKDYAQYIADFILTYYGEANPVYEVEIICNPYAELHDLVTITNFTQLSVFNEEFYVIANDIKYDGGIEQTLTLRKRVVT